MVSYPFPVLNKLSSTKLEHYNPMHSNQSMHKNWKSIQDRMDWTHLCHVIFLLGHVPLKSCNSLIRRTVIKGCRWSTSTWRLADNLRSRGSERHEADEGIQMPWNANKDAEAVFFLINWWVDKINGCPVHRRLMIFKDAISQKSRFGKIFLKMKVTDVLKSEPTANGRRSNQEKKVLKLSATTI